jgi:hypothetical protein
MLLIFNHLRLKAVCLKKYKIKTNSFEDDVGGLGFIKVGEFLHRLGDC